MMIQVILLTTALWSQAASQTVDRWTISAMDACPRMREFERSTAGSRRGGHGNVRQRRQQRTARGTLWSTQASRRPWRQTSDE